MSIEKLTCNVSTTTDMINTVNGLVDFASPSSDFIYTEIAPTGFIWPVDLPIVKASKVGNQYHCNVTPFDLFNPATIAKSYYVDPVYGLNASSGTLPSTPVQSIWRAIELMKTQSTGLGGRIMLKGAFYPVEHGFLNANTTVDLQNRPVSFEAQHGRAVISLSTKMTFVKDAGYSNVYTASQALSLMAFNPSVKSNDGYTHLKYKSVFSIAAVESTAGSFYFNTATSVCYVHPHGSVPATNENVRVIQSVKQLSTSNSNVIFMQGLDLEGGSLGYIYEASANVRVGSFVAVDSTFRFNLGGTFDAPEPWSAISNSNFKIKAFFNCDISRCSRDGLATSKAAVNQNCSLFSVNCKSLNNGFLTEDYSNAIRPSSCNGFTLHNGMSGIDIGGTYTGSAGGNVAIVHQDTQAWCFGTIVGDSDGDKINGGSITYGGVSCADLDAKIWLDSCVVKGTEKALFASANSTIFKRRTIYSGTINGGSGTVVDY